MITIMMILHLARQQYSCSARFGIILIHLGRLPHKYLIASALANLLDNLRHLWYDEKKTMETFQ